MNIFIPFAFSWYNIIDLFGGQINESEEGTVLFSSASLTLERPRVLFTDVDPALTCGKTNKEREPSSKAQMVKECYIPTLRTENNLLTCDFLPCSPVGAGAPLSGSLTISGKSKQKTAVFRYL